MLPYKIKGKITVYIILQVFNGDRKLEVSLLNNTFIE
jgi:hypothetical protein